MGELLALLSASCFAAANVTIIRGANGKDNGAFLSILMTAALAGLLWAGTGATRGWPEINAEGVLWFALAGVLTVFIGRVFLFASVQSLGAVRASAIKRLNPVFAVLLGVLVLGESLDSSTLLGMLLIFVSFGVLLHQSLTARAAKDKPEHLPKQSWKQSLANFGYGPISALAYASGYVARKYGLVHLPDPAFGTLLGAAVGATCFLLAARFIDSYRVAVRSTFNGFNPWLYAAAAFASAGQLFYFFALSHTTISKVALISSIEVFVTMFFSVVLFRVRGQLSPPVVIAAVLGVAGTAVMVLGSA